MEIRSAVAALLAGCVFFAACDAGRQTPGRAAGEQGTQPVATYGPPQAAAAPSALASDSGAIVVGDHAVIRSEAVGPLRVGTWRRPVMSLVYAVGATAGPAGEDMIAVRGIGKDTLTLAIVDDTLRRIEVTRPGAHTRDGITVGTPLSTVLALPGATGTATGTGRTVTVPQYCGVQFLSDTSAARSGNSGRSTVGRNTVGRIIVGACSAGGATPPNGK